MSDWPIVMPAQLSGGKLTLNRERLQALLAGRRDGDLTLTFERRHATRSAAQNAWYWACILPALADYTGYTIDEMHEFCKRRFNAKQVIVTNAHGEIVDEERIGQTTTLLNKLTFGEYCESIRQWAAAELDINIPDPDVDWRHRAPDEELTEAS